MVVRPALHVHLERPHVPRLLCRVTLRPNRSIRVIAVLTGTMAVAATAGAILGFGMRAGTPARGFNVLASFVLGDQARGVWGWSSTVTLTGIALHVAMMMGWGVLFALVAVTLRGWRLAAVAVGMGLGIWVVSTFVVLRGAGAGAEEVLGTGQVAGLHVVLAVALAVGMRFARSMVRSDPQRRAASQEHP